MNADGLAHGAVYLTFDDGPDKRWTPAVLDALDAVGARATFFVIAPLAAAQPQLIARMQDAGHSVQLHCDEHVRHTYFEDGELEADTARALERLDALGVHPTCWRAPWGVTTPRTEDVAAAHGLRLVHWTADTEDWAGHTPTAMLDRVEAGVESGGIVLAHDGLGPGALRAGCAGTVALIAPLVALAHRRGLDCTALDAPGVLEHQVAA